VLSPCRVESVEESAPLSHADFLFRSVLHADQDLGRPVVPRSDAQAAGMASGRSG